MKKFNVVTRNNRHQKIKDYIIKKLSTQYLYDDIKPEVCFVVGGDGTFLHAIHHYLDDLDNIVFVGINGGTLGYYSDYTLDDYQKCIDDFINKQGHLEEYSLICAQSDLNQKYYALNEIRVETLRRAQLIEVYIDDQLFETFRGSGFLVCSPFGSSAYNRSLNGSIVSSKVPCLQLTEISPVVTPKYPSLNSSLILPVNTKITLKNKYYEDVSILNDHFEYKLTKEKEIDIYSSEKKVKVLRLKDYNFIKRIKKLF